MERIQEDFAAGKVPEAEFTIYYGYSKNGFETGLLRAAYLACFERFGYEYVQHDLIQSIRRRIENSKLNESPIESMVVKIHPRNRRFDSEVVFAADTVKGVDVRCS